MRHRRADVVARAIAVLDAYGLADLSMRRLGAELDVQPSALYHHFRDKQTLLAAVADEVLARGRRPRTAVGWSDRVREVCTELRDAMLAYRDGADVVATARALGLGGLTAERELVQVLQEAGFAPGLAGPASRTLLVYVVGHTVDAQTHLQAGSAGAIDDGPRDADDFEVGLELLLDGLRVREGVRSQRRAR